MRHRFRFIGSAVSSGAWNISGEEAHHLQKVLKLTAGTEVEVTDGWGGWAIGPVAEARGNDVRVEVRLSGREEASVAPLTVAFGALKPATVDDLLAPLTELGVERVLVVGQQKVAKARLTEKVQDRWQRILQQSVKQCKRSWLPELETVDSVEELSRFSPSGTQKLLLDAEAVTPIATVPLEAEAPCLAVVGGEKGFEPEETEELERQGFRAVYLGPHVLRAETAVVSAAAVIAARRAAGGCGE